MRLDDQIAVVTGAASGIGLATAAAFQRAGACVYMADLDADHGTKAAEELKKQGGPLRECGFLQMDVADRASVNKAAETVMEKSGRVDIIVNAAGMGKIQPFVDNDDEFIDKVVAVNLMGSINVVRAFLPKMIESQRGKIINVSSDAGRVGSLGETVYSGAKGGVIGFTKSLARETARFNINVNCICPGPTDTPLLQRVPEKHREAFRRAIPMKRFGTPEEIANAILFFASGGSDYITGQVLSVSGGLTMVD